jgi:hypothetical protein
MQSWAHAFFWSLRLRSHAPGWNTLALALLGLEFCAFAFALFLLHSLIFGATFVLLDFRTRKFALVRQDPHTARTGQLKQDRQNRTGKTGQDEEESRIRTGGRGQAEEGR